MSKAKEKLSEAERSEIVRNILNAKDKRLQLKIEADLHLTSVTAIKEILKERGFSLRILNGGGKQKHVEDEIITPVENIEAVEEQAEPDVIGQAWADLSIPPDEPLPPPAPAEQVKSSIPEETAADSTESEVDIDLSYQRFKALIREKAHCEDRLTEINAELLLYRDTCNCILIDLKEGGIST